MRDIRQDLRERLAEIAGRYADEMADYVRKRESLEQSHTAAVAELERQKHALEQMLSIEIGRHGASPREAEIKTTAHRVALADFLVTKVHAHGPMEKDQLRAEADLAGYFEEGNGRTFHTTLMNITNGGRLVRLPDGRYAFPQREPILFDTGDDDARAMN